VLAPKVHIVLHSGARRSGLHRPQSTRPTALMRNRRLLQTIWCGPTTIRTACRRSPPTPRTTSARSNFRRN
jgi:hypothetical protein